MHHHWCQQHLRTYHNGSAIIITIQSAAERRARHRACFVAHTKWVRSPVQKHSCEAPGSSVALPESSGKAAEGFGRVLNGKYGFFIDFWGPRGGARDVSSRPRWSWDPLTLKNWALKSPTLNTEHRTLKKIIHSPRAEARWRICSINHRYIIDRYI